MKKQKGIKDKREDITIVEVYEDNFISEIKKISLLLQKYNYIGMDTEFPGVVYGSTMTGREAYYRTIKTNVDNLKLIQVGITLSNEKGVGPSPPTTWQFNLKFNLGNDEHSNESIALLTNSGINFEILQSRGIPISIFGEYFITSGLILNEDIYWISFHGIYDFGYLLKAVTDLPLPETESLFFETLKLYFPNLYDIRYLVRFNENLRVSLARLGQELGIPRVGISHQAGSDSLLTSSIFFKIRRDYIDDETIFNDRNILFGIGPGAEENQNYSMGGFFGNNSGSEYKMTGNTLPYDYNFYHQQQNMINMQYSYLRSRDYFMSNNGINNGGYFSYNGYNGNGVPFVNNNQPGNVAEEAKKKYTVKGFLED